MDNNKPKMPAQTSMGKKKPKTPAQTSNNLFDSLAKTNRRNKKPGKKQDDSVSPLKQITTGDTTAIEDPGKGNELVLTKQQSKTIEEARRKYEDQLWTTEFDTLQELLLNQETKTLITPILENYPTKVQTLVRVLQGAESDELIKDLGKLSDEDKSIFFSWLQPRSIVDFQQLLKGWEENKEKWDNMLTVYLDYYGDIKRFTDNRLRDNIKFFLEENHNQNTAAISSAGSYPKEKMNVYANGQHHDRWAQDNVELNAVILYIDDQHQRQTDKPLHPFLRERTIQEINNGRKAFKERQGAGRAKTNESESVGLAMDKVINLGLPGIHAEIFATSQQLWNLFPNAKEGDEIPGNAFENVRFSVVRGEDKNNEKRGTDMWPCSHCQAIMNGMTQISLNPLEWPDWKVTPLSN